MKEFSNIEYTFENFIKEFEEEKKLLESKPLPPFSESEMTIERRNERIEKSKNDFWFFDKIYFAQEIYESYAKPNKMLKDIVSFSQMPGYHLFIGPRKHGKTVTSKKFLIWLLLINKIKIAGVYSETMIKSASLLKDIYRICINNDKLLYDFKIEFEEANSDNLTFTSLINVKKERHFISSFSEGRSVKGFTKIFSRPNFLLADDIETMQSSFSKSAVQERIDKLAESFHSLSDNSSFLILANDFIDTSAVHQLRLQYEQNLLPKNFNVYVYRAWQNNKPLWHSKYKAKTELELKKIIEPLSEADWQANYQANPIPPEGYYFKRDYYNEMNFSSDARGIIYCDPNLSKKGRGDTTAIVTLFYSSKEDKYFVAQAICKSYNDSNELLKDIMTMKNHFGNKVISIAFDGNVSQESTWTQHIRNFCVINNIPFPLIEYKKYRVDDLAKNLQLAFDDNKIYFPLGFSKTENGERFLSQFFSFSGKKDNKKDDAPDALICAFEFIHERRLTKKINNNSVLTFNDYYKI